MNQQPSLVAFACAAVWIWSCNALWGVDELSFDGVVTEAGGGMGGATSSTSTGAGGLTASGGMGGVGGGPSNCQKACADLFDCGLQDGLCPGFAEDQRSLFLDGCDPGTGCLAQCEAMPALAAIVDPSDCATTVQTMGAASVDFAEGCNNGIGGCGGAGTGGAAAAGFGPR